MAINMIGTEFLLKDNTKLIDFAILELGKD